MSWRADYAILIFTSTVVDYAVGLALGRTQRPSMRRVYLVVSILTNLGILFAFKYFNFLNDSFQTLFTYYGLPYGIPELDVLLPVGISFYTFQSLSYTIDVYRGAKEPEKHFGIFALYVSFFPQLVAGPIERSTHLLPQFFQKFTFDYERVTSGLRLMLWGFFKKIVIADNLAVLVNQVYNSPTNYEGPILIFVTVCFAYQIYCDFSGYSDIAIGAARVMGFTFMDNFRTPYFSRSISEFWQRWHISLSTWFKDYLYIPLGGNRVVRWRWYYNLFITFLISGLWHGANWTFVVWGALHGFYLILGIVLAPVIGWLIITTTLDKRPTLLAGIQIATTFTLVCFAWILFRANNLAEATYIITHLVPSLDFFTNLLAVSNVSEARSFLRTFFPIFQLGLSNSQLLYLLASILLLETVQIFQYRDNLSIKFRHYSGWVRWAYYYGMTLWILTAGRFGEEQFIYFQF